MNEKDLPTVLWCLLVVLLFFFLFWLYCITTVTTKWSGRGKENRRVASLADFFFPAPCMGACLQAKKETGTGTDRSGRMSCSYWRESLAVRILLLKV